MKQLLLVWLAVLTLAVFFVQCVERQDVSDVKEIIVSENAPAAIGPYSQAVKVGDILFCSGQIPIDPETGELVSGPIAEQTHRVLQNLGAVLREAGMDFSDVVRATVYMKDMENYAAINEVYGTYFSENPPARCAVEVSRLPKDVDVEISFIAIRTH